MKQSEVISEYLDDIRSHTAGVSDGIETFSTRGIISPGCHSCKSGTWMCVFLGQTCNVTCAWCPNTNPGSTGIMVSGGMINYNAGNLYEEILASTRNPLIRGVSFSGGEPLLRKDEIISLARSIRNARNDIYLWVYTNGILLDNENIASLVDAGVQEIRVDLAATCYDKSIVKKLEDVSRRIDATVEVPVLEEHVEILIGILPQLQDIGVKYINLHDLYVPPLWEKARKTFDSRFIYVDPVTKIQRYLPSLEWIHAVMRAGASVAPFLNFNECSLPNLSNQWLAFRWQKMRWHGETQEDFADYKRRVLPELRQKGLVL